MLEGTCTSKRNNEWSSQTEMLTIDLVDGCVVTLIPLDFTDGGRVDARNVFSFITQVLVA